MFAPLVLLSPVARNSVRSILTTLRRLIRIVIAASSASSLRVLSTTRTFLIYLFSRTSNHPWPPSLPRHRACR